MKLSSVISAGESNDRFTRSLFESILTEKGIDILNEYKPSSYKAFFNGNSAITKIAQKINAYIEPMEFSSYIDNYPDAVIENLCHVFVNDIPDIEPGNAGEKLAELFSSIIITAAGTTKKNPQKLLIKVFHQLS